MVAFDQARLSNAAYFEISEKKSNGYIARVRCWLQDILKRLWAVHKRKGILPYSLMETLDQTVIIENSKHFARRYTPAQHLLLYLQKIIAKFCPLINDTLILIPVPTGV